MTVNIVLQISAFLTFGTAPKAIAATSVDTTNMIPGLHGRLVLPMMMVVVGRSGQPPTFWIR